MTFPEPLICCCALEELQGAPAWREAPQRLLEWRGRAPALLRHAPELTSGTISQLVALGSGKLCCCSSGEMSVFCNTPLAEDPKPHQAVV